MGLWLDLRSAVRWLRARPAFVVVGVLTTAAAVAVTTTVVAMFDAVVLRSVPGPNAAHLLSISQTSADAASVSIGFSYSEFRQLKHQLEGTVAVEAFERPSLMHLDGGKHQFLVAAVSEGFFSLFKISPAAGRWISTGDAQDGRTSAVLSFRTWQNYFSRGEAIGTLSVRAGETTYRVVGVAPPSFRMPADVDVWVVDPALARDQSDGGERQCQVIGLVTSSSSVETIRRQHVAIAGSQPGLRLKIQTLRERLLGPVGTILALAAGLVGLVGAIGGVNVWALFAARNADRRREFSIRAALGASAARVMRQSWIESAIVVGVGAVLGVGAGLGIPRLLARFGPIEIAPGLRDAMVAPGIAALVGLSGAALLFAAGVVSARMPDATSQLSGRCVGRAVGARLGFRAGLIGFQAAMALVLVTTANVAVGRLLSALTIDVGFALENLQVLELSPPPRPDLDGAAAQSVMEDLQHIPGVTSVAAVAYLRHMPVTTMAAERSPGVWIPFPSPTLTYQIASEGLFDTLGIPLLAGRTFGPQDAWDAPCTLIVNATFAAAAWPRATAVGQRVNLATTHDGVPLVDDPAFCAVVGVVGDIRTQLEVPPGPQVYFWYKARRFSPGTNTFFVRLQNRALTKSFASEMRPRLTKWDRRVESMGQMETLVRQSIVAPRFYSVIFGALAALALLLSAFGIHGTIAETVVTRRRELAIRMALGASPASIVTLVLSFAAGRLGVGIAVAVPLCVAVARGLGNQLVWHGGLVSTMTASIAVLSGVALVAAWPPAKRASELKTSSLLR